MIGRVHVLSWNLGMFEPSAQAPPWWSVEASEEFARRSLVSWDADIVCLQELPGLVPYVETHDMVRANPRTHSGNLAVLVRHELMPGVTHRTVGRHGLAVTFADHGFTVVNVHLAPGPGAGGERLVQLAEAVEASPTPSVLVIGDTNTRKDELSAITDAGLQTVDPPRPTWDSRRNRFRDDAPKFTAYFTRWFASPDLAVADVLVHDEPVVHDGRRFHLSDHHALSVHVTVPGG